MAQEEMAGIPHGTFCWTEVATTDADKSQAFFESVFGWKFHKGEASGGGMDYREFTTGEPYPAGGLYQMDPSWFDGAPPPPHFLVYVGVDDVDENARLAVELGGKVVKGPMDIPNVGRMAIIEDPTGAKLATFKPNM